MGTRSFRDRLNRIAPMILGGNNEKNICINNSRNYELLSVLMLCDG